MAAKTYKIRALVLKKTKLGEKDLIVTLIDDTGALVKGVAKGARKPGGSFAARLELFSDVTALMAQGRSLDVICEAKLNSPAGDLARSLEKSACAAPLAELLCNVAQPRLRQPRVFEISQAALRLMGSRDSEPGACLALCAASLWKVMAQIGFRPSFSSCVFCGNAVETAHDEALRLLSVAEGGVFCESCSASPDAVWEKTNVLRWCDALIMMRYPDILASGIDPSTCMDVLCLAQMWAREHTGRNLKSLDFLLSSALF